MFVTRIRGVLTVVLVVGLALGIRLGVGLPTKTAAVAQEKTGDQALDGLWEDIENKGGWLRFDGTTIKYHPAGKSDEILEWTCRYNLTLTPMTIDIFQKGATSHGILVGERGTLFIALARPGEERPTRFVRDEATRLFVLKRKTAEEKEKPKTEGKVPDGVEAAQAATFGANSGKKKDAETISRLIKQLGDDDFEKREAASRELDSIGEPAVSALRKAVASSPDVEIRRRAETIIGGIAARALAAAARKEIEALQGAWYSTSSACNGVRQTGEERGARHIFTADRWENKNGETLLQSGTLRFVEVNDKLVKIDFIVTEGHRKGDTWLAVYERKGDDLQWCGGYVGQSLARPTTLTTKRGDGGYFLRSLKREKE
jgi:uncharacterized protein (TIGR03067 family)